MALIKAYALVAMNGFFFALGATQATRAMTVNYCRTIIGLGLHLMTLYLLLGVGQNLGVSWALMTKAAAQQHELMPMFVILVAVIVYYFILKNLPAFMASLSGVHGFRHEGAVVVAMAINASRRGHATLSQGQNHVTNALQGGANALKTAAHAGRSFKQGYQQGQGGWSNVQKGAATVVSDFSHATANTLKNSVNANRPPSTVQQFNHHLANRLQQTDHQKQDQ